MKLAVLSDIHANLHALEAVLDDVKRVRPDMLYCLGDLVGHGAYPNEVIDLMRKWVIPGVMGNYDEGVGFDLSDCGSLYPDPEDDRRGRMSLMWSRRQVTPDRKNYLCGLPLQIRQHVAGLHLLFVHGSPRRINEYLYAEGAEATFEQVAKLAGCDVLFMGHTHVSYQKRVGKTLFVNAGSVGRPKDGDPRAEYVLVELAQRPTFEFRRVAYDVAAAARAVRESGLPSQYADALESGGKPLAARPAATSVSVPC